MQSASVQSRLFKSLKLWSFYVDLEESIGSVKTTKAVYDQMFELKIANAQIVINYANFLEENEYWEESFKVGFSHSRFVTQRLTSCDRFTSVVSTCSATRSHSSFGTPTSRNSSSVTAVTRSNELVIYSNKLSNSVHQSLLNHCF